MPATVEQVLHTQSFENETVSGLELAEADLSEKEFVDVTFDNVKLQLSRWTRARLEDCVFTACDLTRIAPAQLRLRGVEFKNCKMIGIDWTNLSPYPVMSFVDCNLSYSSFVSLSARKTLFTRCALVETNFVEADLVQAKFEDCRFTGARFETCNLERATFAGARELLIDPAKNRVRGASIPLESALLLAASFGLKVTGFEPGSE